MIQIEHQPIVQAFQAIINPGQSQHRVKEADGFLNECQKNPNFAIILLDVFQGIENPQTKWQILLHLKNVISRNWTTNRRANEQSLNQQMKRELKKRLLLLYQAHWQHFYKHFNQIFKFLARKDFPAHYQELYDFVRGVLSTLATLSIQQILTSQELLPYLSLVKIILKEFKHRTLGNNRQIYEKYTIHLIILANTIGANVNQALQYLHQNSTQVENKSAIKLLECSRKIDKILFYGLQCIPNEVIVNEIIQHVIQASITKLIFLLNFEAAALKEDLELNILAIVEGLKQIQIKFPFAMLPYLSKYFQIIIQLLFTVKKFENDRIASCIIRANIKPMITLPYYMNEQEFKNNIYARKGKQNFENEQRQCHTIFMSFYGPPNTEAYLEKILTELLPQFQKQNQEDELIFEGAEKSIENENEIPAYDLLMMLLKSIVTVFKNDLKGFFDKVMNHLIEQNSGSNAVGRGMNDFVLNASTVYDENELDREKFFKLMEKSYMVEDYSAFSKILQYCYSFFTPDLLKKCFSILIQISAKKDINHFVLYQCATCIKKLLEEYDDLPLENLGLCFSNIFQLLIIYKDNPNHLWNLLQLLTQILKTLPSATIAHTVPYMLGPITTILEMKASNKSLTICAMAQFLETLLGYLSPFDNHDINLSIEQLAMNLVTGYFEFEDMQDVNSLYMLWVAVIRVHRIDLCASEFNQNLLMFFKQRSEEVLAEDAEFYCQLMQEYLLSGLLQLAPEDIIAIFTNLLSDPSNPNISISLSLFSLYFTYSKLNNIFIAEIVVLGMKVIVSFLNKISRPVNIIRAQILLIFSHHLITYGPPNIFPLLNSVWPTYQVWFWPYVWSLSFITNKYSFKIISYALLFSFPILQDRILGTPIDGNLPFDSVIKCITVQLEPLTQEEAKRMYSISLMMNFIEDSSVDQSRFLRGKHRMSRKIELHVNNQWAQCDLRPVFAEKLLGLMKAWDWGMDDIQERFDQNLALKIRTLLIL